MWTHSTFSDGSDADILKRTASGGVKLDILMVPMEGAVLRV